MKASIRFGVGGALALFAIFALAIAARYGTGSAYQGGIVLFLYMIALIFFLITRTKFDEPDEPNS